jgi:hypothetical protein
MELDRNKLLNIYESIKDKCHERDAHIKRVDEIDKEISSDILEYRIASVSRVLDFIHTSLATNSSIDLDTLITHCCNKLNGNIDGIELQLGGK